MDILHSDVEATILNYSFIYIKKKASHCVHKVPSKIAHRYTTQQQVRPRRSGELTKGEEVATREVEQRGPQRSRRHRAFASITTNLRSK